MATSSRTQTALIAAVALVVGFGAAQLFQERGPEAARSRASARSGAPEEASAQALADVRALTDTLASLQAALRSLTAALAASPPSSLAERRARPTPAEGAAPVLEAPQREPMGAESAELARIAPALEAIAAALQGLDGAAPGASPIRTRPLVSPGWVDRERVFAAAGLRAVAQSSIDGEFDAAMDAFRQRHLLWTQQEVLTRYGKPDRIDFSSAQPQWLYLNRFPGGSEEFYFSFHEGVLFDVEYGQDLD